MLLVNLNGFENSISFIIRGRALHFRFLTVYLIVKPNDRASIKKKKNKQQEKPVQQSKLKLRIIERGKVFQSLGVNNVTETWGVCRWGFLLGQRFDCNICVPSDHICNPSCFGTAQPIWLPFVGLEGDFFTEVRSGFSLVYAERVEPDQRGGGARGLRTSDKGRGWGVKYGSNHIWVKTAV